MIDETQGTGPAEDATADAPTIDEGAAPPETPSSPPGETSADVNEPPSSPDRAAPEDESPGPDEKAPVTAPADADAELEQLRQAVADGEQPQVHGADQVTAQFRADQEQGFHGQKVSDIPNDHHTLPGQAGEPETPEGSDAQ